MIENAVKTKDANIIPLIYNNISKRNMLKVYPLPISGIQSEVNIPLTSMDVEGMKN